MNHVAPGDIPSDPLPVSIYTREPTHVLDEGFGEVRISSKLGGRGPLMFAAFFYLAAFLAWLLMKDLESAEIDSATKLAAWLICFCMATAALLIWCISRQLSSDMRFDLRSNRLRLRGMVRRRVMPEIPFSEIAALQTCYGGVREPNGSKYHAFQLNLVIRRGRTPERFNLLECGDYEALAAMARKISGATGIPHLDHVDPGALEELG